MLQFRGEGIREFRLEGLLEAFLLMNPHHLYQMSGIPEAVNETFRAQVFNQVSAYVAGGAIDIVCLYEKKVRGLWLTLLATVFELKKNTLSMDNLDQLIENVKWAARLLPGASDEMVRGVLVGRTFGGDSEKKLELQKALQSLEKNSWIKVFEYAVEDADSVSFKEIPAG